MESIWQVSTLLKKSYSGIYYYIIQSQSNTRVDWEILSAQ